MTAGFQGFPIVKIEEAEVPPDVINLFETLVIDDHLHLPDKLTIVVRDPSRDSLGKGGFTIGAKIEVAVVSTGRGASDGDEPLFKGEITGLEGDYDVVGQRVVVRAYDLSHRMHRGRHTQAYKNKTDADIARELAGRCALPVGTVDPTSPAHDHVSQVNLTDWEFIKARAREIGFEAGVSDGKFFFRRPKVNQGAPAPGDLDATGPLQMVFGADLMEFHPRVSAVSQVAEVKARGWNYLDKQPVLGNSTPDAENNAPELASTPVALGRKFPGTKPFVLTDRVLATQSEAEQAAKGLSRQISSAMAEADGVARGNPKIKAGAAMKVSAVAEPFVGTWTVTASCHSFDTKGYKTTFSVAGRQERSLLGLTSLGATSGVGSAGGPPIFGVVVGLVTNIKDPDGMHRVKLKFPWLSDDYETWWARSAQVGAGNERGLSWLPEVDDEVLVAFEQGDVRRPYVIGMLFNGKDKVAKGNGTKIYDGSGKSVLKELRSRTGHHLIFQDGFSGKEAALLETADEKHSLLLSQGENKIILHTDGTIEISSKQDMTIKTDQNLKMKATMNLEIEAGAELSMKGVSVKVNGSATVDVKGGLISLN
jgi:phage protein D